MFVVRHQFMLGGSVFVSVVGRFGTRAEAERHAEAMRAEYAAVTDCPPWPSRFEVAAEEEAPCRNV